MDLLGDIVEKVPDQTQQNDIHGEKNGFPELYKPKKISSWKQRLREKNQKKTPPGPVEPVKLVEPAKPKTEAQSIHMENLNTMQGMSQEQILREKTELLNSLDPKLIQNLLKNINNRQNDETPLFAEIEGASGTWVGGPNENFKNLPQLDNDQVNKSLQISSTPLPLPKETEPEVVLELEEDDVAPLDYQVAQSIDHMANEELLKDVHFISQATKEDDDDTPLDINDPDFDKKLHDKYFPNLPKDVDKLRWMQPAVSDGEETKTIIDDVSECRFDFKGNLVPPTRVIENTSQSGLHHHSDDPQLAGYTLVELTHLSRSTFPSQRAIAIQTIGRVLYKLGKQSYYQLIPEIDSETYKEDGSLQNVMNKIYSMFWDLVKALGVIEWIEYTSIERNTPNLSVRNYAIDALWLWKKGGGDFRKRQENVYKNTQIM